MKPGCFVKVIDSGKLDAENILRLSKLYEVVKVHCNGSSVDYVLLKDTPCPYTQGWPNVSGYWAASRFEVVVEPPALDLTKPVQTRDGRPARVVCSNVQGGVGLPLLYLITQQCGEEVARFAKVDGRFYPYDTSDDLVNVPPPKAEAKMKGYLWRSTTGKVFVTHDPDRRDHCNSGGGATLIGTGELTITEGEGL